MHDGVGVAFGQRSVHLACLDQIRREIGVGVLFLALAPREVDGPVPLVVQVCEDVPSDTTVPASDGDRFAHTRRSSAAHLNGRSPVTAERHFLLLGT
jgi:hypothetical protein